MATFYSRLAVLLDYIENHLDTKLNFDQLARLAGVNLSTLQRVFPLFAGITLGDYIRKRRLTLAGRDLIQTDYRIADLAAQYGYCSTESFSRAFRKFHGINPSQARLSPHVLQCYPRLSLPELISPCNHSYEIVELPDFELYGFGLETNFDHIKVDAPSIYLELERKYPTLGHPDYGMITYHHGRDSHERYEYCVLWTNPPQAPETRIYRVPNSRWIKFVIPSQEAIDIQRSSDQFYCEFLPTCPYRLKNQPELEHYHDAVTDFLIPII